MSFATKSFFLLAGLTSLSLALPTYPDAQPATAAVFTSKQYNIYPRIANSAEDLVPHMDLKWSRDAGKVEVTQSIVVFSGVPAEAKTCRLKWRQSDTPGLFSQAVVGSVTVLQVADDDFPTGAPAQPVTRESTQAHVDLGLVRGTINFENWVGAPGQSHNGPQLSCGEKIVLRLTLDEPTELQWANPATATDDPRVFLVTDLDEQSGLYVEVTY